MEQLAVRASAHLICRTCQVEVIVVFRRLKEDNLKGDFIGELAGRNAYGGSIRGLRRKRGQKCSIIGIRWSHPRIEGGEYIRCRPARNEDVEMDDWDEWEI